MKKYLLLICLITFLFAGGLRSQEKLFDLGCNSVLMDKHNTESKEKSAAPPIFSNPYNIISLPFFDDFRIDSPYPDTSKWIDNTVFINTDYPIAPINIGVATFDGLNKYGFPYDFTAPPTASVPCDTLTSKRIHLGPYAFPTDSIYLSFYYQAQGRGNQPEPEDSLFLEFRGSKDSTWREVWAHFGYQCIAPDTNFHRVMIPVMDTALYYNKSWFQFRFRNYATPCGNLDHWNLDFVKLDHSRNIHDTILPVVSFVYMPLSFLANYQSMPWKQYSPADMGSNAHIYIRNNSASAVNMTYQYQGSHYGIPYSSSWSAVDPGLPPFATSGYSTYAPCATPPISGNGFSFGTSLSDTTMFEINHILYQSVVNRDTVRSKQRFYNFYAHDDGTAELGYGLEGNGTLGAMLAVKYATNIKDTLKAIQIFWNPIILDVSSRTFRLCIWGPGSNGPGPLLYQSDSLYSPRYMPYYNHFHTYKIDTILPILGTFYVGYVQFTEDNMSVGFDQNTNTQNDNYFKTTGGWNTSIFPGSLMIRPLFGDTIKMVGIKEIALNLSHVNVYPNPAQDHVLIRIPENDEQTPFTAEVLDMFGKRILLTRLTNSDQLDVSSLPNGFYMIRITDPMLGSCTKKLMITR
jgi:hypothetical protein